MDTTTTTKTTAQQSQRSSQVWKTSFRAEHCGTLALMHTMHLGAMITEQREWILLNGFHLDSPHCCQCVLHAMPKAPHDCKLRTDSVQHMNDNKSNSVDHVLSSYHSHFDSRNALWQNGINTRCEFCIKSAKDNSQCVNKLNFSLQPTDHRLVFSTDEVKVTISKTFLHLNERYAVVCALYKYVFHAGCQMFSPCLLQINYSKEMLNTYSRPLDSRWNYMDLFVYHFCVKVHIHLCHSISLIVPSYIVKLLRSCATGVTISLTGLFYKENIM